MFGFIDDPFHNLFLNEDFHVIWHKNTVQKANMFQCSTVLSPRCPSGLHLCHDDRKVQGKKVIASNLALKKKRKKDTTPS